MDRKEVLKTIGNISKEVMPELLKLVPVVGTVAGSCAKSIIKALESMGEEEKDTKNTVEDLVKKAQELEKELKESADNADKADEIVKKQVNVLFELAKQGEISEEALFDMIKSAVLEEVKKSSKDMIFPIYFTGFILYSEEEKLSQEIQDILWEAIDICSEISFDDDDVNEIIGKIRNFTMCLDTGNDCFITDSFASFYFCYEDTYTKFDSYNQTRIVEFMDNLNQLIAYLDYSLQQPFYRTYQLEC